MSVLEGLDPEDADAIEKAFVIEYWRSSPDTMPCEYFTAGWHAARRHYGLDPMPSDLDRLPEDPHPHPHADGPALDALCEELDREEKGGAQ